MTSQVAWRLEWLEKGGCWLANNQHSLNLYSNFCMVASIVLTAIRIIPLISFEIEETLFGILAVWFPPPRLQYILSGFWGNKVFSERCHHQEHPSYPRGTIVFLFMFSLSTPVTIIVTINCMQSALCRLHCVDCNVQTLIYRIAECNAQSAITLI